MNSNEKHEICLMEHEDNLTHIINQLEIGELVSCENCGNIWDGHAQCNCWQWNDVFPDYSSNNSLNDEINDYYNIEVSYTDNESFTDNDEYDSDFDPAIYGGDATMY